MYLYICLCVLCIVICMHSFHSAHIFKVCNSVICPTHSIFNYGHIVKLYSHFVYSPLNSYVYIHWILDFKYIYYIIIKKNLKGVHRELYLNTIFSASSIISSTCLNDWYWPVIHRSSA